MLAEADRQAHREGITNVIWRHLRAEQLPADLARPTLVTFAQSFHWMDRPRVAATVRSMLADDGALVHVSADTHEGVRSEELHPHPAPPRAAVAALIREYLGEARRAGRSVLPGGTTPGDEDDVYRTAGFRGPHYLELPGRSVRCTVDEVRHGLLDLRRRPAPVRHRPRRLRRGPAHPAHRGVARRLVQRAVPPRQALDLAVRAGARSCRGDPGVPRRPTTRPSTPRTRATSCAGTAPRPTTRPA